MGYKILIWVLKGTSTLLIWCFAAMLLYFTFHATPALWNSGNNLPTFMNVIGHVLAVIAVVVFVFCGLFMAWMGWILLVEEP